MSATDPTTLVIRVRAEEARDEIVRLCKPGERWRMSIPADTRRDSDLILMDALDALTDALAAACAEIERMTKAFVDRQGSFEASPHDDADDARRAETERAMRVAYARTAAALSHPIHPTEGDLT